MLYKITIDVEQLSIDPQCPQRIKYYAQKTTSGITQVFTTEFYQKCDLIKTLNALRKEANLKFKHQQQLFKY